MYIRKDDVVEVVTGDDKGTRGKVLKVLRGRNQVVVEGVNRVYRHLKPSRRDAVGRHRSDEVPTWPRKSPPPSRPPRRPRRPGCTPGTARRSSRRWARSSGGRTA